MFCFIRIVLLGDFETLLIVLICQTASTIVLGAEQHDGLPCLSSDLESGPRFGLARSKVGGRAYETPNVPKAIKCSVEFPSFTSHLSLATFISSNV